MSDFSFPLGIAKNTYFCNRVDETAKLIDNIRHQTHTVLIAPRRYGKTSLAYRAIKKSGEIHAIVDLFMAGNRPDIEQAILKGVNDIIAQVSGITEKWLKKI